MIEEPLMQMVVSNEGSIVGDSTIGVKNTKLIKSNGQIGVIRQRDGGTILLTPQNFQVLALESSLQTSDVSQTYSALLIYTCNRGNVIEYDDNDPNFSYGHEDIVILSRTPTLPFETINDFLNVATGYGISSTTCDSPFIPNLQPPIYDCSDTNNDQEGNAMILC